MTNISLQIAFPKEFKKSEYPGIYIVIEGIDGSGKSTQIKRLAAFFKEKGREVTITGEPNSTLPTEKLIRDVLFGHVKIPSKAYQFLYSADRALNHESIIEPALKRGDVVISHRSFWSAIAHGVIDRGEESFTHQHVDPLIVSQGILSYYHQFIVADYTFYLSVPVDTAMARLSKMSKQSDIYEKRDKLMQIFKGYSFLKRTFPAMITEINGEEPVESITKQIVASIK